jgi:outer membrane protein assembly factor BamB
MDSGATMGAGSAVWHIRPSLRLPATEGPMNLRLWLSVAVFCVCSISVNAQEWARFRGPNGQGVGKADLPAKWSAENVQWKIDLPGTGHSSPILWGDKLFLTCTDAATAKRIVMCINEKDGSIRWRRDFETPTYRQHADNSYASSSPAADEQHVYLLWSTPEAYTLRALTHDGKDVWTANLGVYKSAHGSGTSPVLYKELVIVTKDDEGANAFIIALDRKTGKEVWRVKRKQTKMAASTPCILTLNGQDQLITTSMHEGIAAYEPMTGKLLWQIADSQPQRPVGSPVLCDDVIISACGEGGWGRHMFAVQAGTPGRQPKVLYEKVQAQNPPYVPTPVVMGDFVWTLTDQGIMTCWKAKTGEQVWQEKIATAKPGFYGSLVLIGDRIYCADKLGVVYVVRASDKFEVLAKNDLGLDELCSATPAVANGKLYIRTFSKLVCVGAAPGKVAVR